MFRFVVEKTKKFIDEIMLRIIGKYN